MQDIISLLPAEALPQVEKYLRDALAQIEKRNDRRTHAEVWLQKAEERETRVREVLKEAVPRVLDGTLSHADALKMLGKLGLTVWLAEFKLNQEIRRHTNAARERRNREICHLSAQKVSQAEIARRLEVSPSLVRKVLKGEKR